MYLQCLHLGYFLCIKKCTPLFRLLFQQELINDGNTVNNYSFPEKNVENHLDAQDLQRLEFHTHGNSQDKLEIPVISNTKTLINDDSFEESLLRSNETSKLLPEQNDTIQQDLEDQHQQKFDSVASNSYEHDEKPIVRQ